MASLTKEQQIIKTEMEKVLEIFGTKSALARVLEVTPQFVGQWYDKWLIPMEYVYPIKIASNDRIKCSRLRPGKFPETV